MEPEKVASWMTDVMQDGVSDVELEREQYRKKENLRSVVKSIVSTIVFVAIVAATLHYSPGWPKVKESFFSPEYFVQSWPQVVDGILLNIRVLGIALVGGGRQGRGWVEDMQRERAGPADSTERGAGFLQPASEHRFLACLPAR